VYYRVVLIVFACLTLLASGASAHPGHGRAGEGTSLLHYLTEPIHVVGIAALLLSFASGVAILRGRLVRARGVSRKRLP
jgi:hydrogenase/urease accessory protein HupE